VSSATDDADRSIPRNSALGARSPGPVDHEPIEPWNEDAHTGVPPAADQPCLSAVIVYYDDADHLLACVESLLVDPGISEIVVVDNASPGEDAETILRMHHRVQVIQSPTNLGFGGGANLGAAAVTGDLLVFLNPDTLPEPGCMTALAEHLAEQGGVAGPVVRTGADGAPEYGCTVDRMLLPRALNHVVEPIYVQGCCLATTRSCLNAVGGFDTRYFLFQEDVEFCWQALRRGFPVDVVTTASLVHIGGVAAAGGYRRAGRIETSPTRILLRERNSWAVLMACAPARAMPQLLLLSVVRTLAFAGLFIYHRKPAYVARLIGGLRWNVAHLQGSLARRRRSGVTTAGERQAWNRISRQLFLWDLARSGERLRFIDVESSGTGT